MEKEKQEIKDLRKLLEEIYKLLLEMLDVLKRIGAKTKSQQVLDNYVTYYNHARQLKAGIACLDKAIVEDEEFERQLEQKERELNDTFRGKRDVTQVAHMLDWAKKQLGARKTASQSISRVISSRLVGMDIFFSGGFDLPVEGEPGMEEYLSGTTTKEYKNDLRSLLGKLKKAGLHAEHYQMMHCIVGIIVRVKRIIKLLKITKKTEALVDEWITQRVIPNFKREVSALKELNDRDLQQQTQRLMASLKELEALV